MKRRWRGGGFPFASRATPVDEVWRHVAGELGGHVVTGPKKAERLEVPHGEWLIVTDIHTQSTGEGTVTYTRVRALFQRAAPFRLSVTKRTPFHSIGALFGYRPVPMMYPQLDRALFIRADRADLARSLLRGTGLGQQLMRDPLKLEVTRPERRIRRIAGDAVGEVRILKSGIRRDVSEVRSMVQACMQTLDGLARLGIAGGAPEDPRGGVFHPDVARPAVKHR